jgi:hypothetical protein
MLCSDWTILEYEYKACTLKFHDHLPNGWYQVILPEIYWKSCIRPGQVWNKPKQEKLDSKTMNILLPIVSCINCILYLVLIAGCGWQYIIVHHYCYYLYLSFVWVDIHSNHKQIEHDPHYWPLLGSHYDIIKKFVSFIHSWLSNLVCMTRF